MNKFLSINICLLIVLATLISCEKKSSHIECYPLRVITTEVYGYIVNEQGEPISGIHYTDSNTEHDGGAYSDKDGKFTTWASGVASGVYDYKDNVVFYDIDGEENGSYEPLHISDPIVLTLLLETDTTFKPINIGTFVMHSK